jgi:beta-xylosidase
LRYALVPTFILSAFRASKEQVSVGGTSGIWAPTLRLRDGAWYLVTTMVHDKKAADNPTRCQDVCF